MSHVPTDPIESPSTIRKAYFAFTQYRGTIVKIIHETPRLAAAYRLLVILVAVTAALTTQAAVVSYATTGSVGTAVIAFGVLLAGLLAIAPPVLVLLGGVIGGVVAGAQLLWFPVIPLAPLYVAVGLSTVLTILVGTYLTRHAINIGAQLWEQLVLNDLNDTDHSSTTE